MGFDVFPEDKLICVWSDGTPPEALDHYRMEGYMIAYYVRGRKPVTDVLREIVLPRV